MTLTDWRRLLRPRLLFLNCLAAFTGGLLFMRHPLLPLLAATAVLFLAAGATVLNQWQERRRDALMDRTRLRPLVTGQMTATTALSLAGGLVLVGALLLWWCQPAAVPWGLMAVLLYNGIYTPFKSVSELAILPGALCGVLPVVIGGVTAGGSAADYRVLLLAGVLFLWQMPHFWLLAWHYRSEYRQAGLPQLSDRFSASQVHRLTQTWLWCLIPASLLLPLFGLLKHHLSLVTLVAALFFFAVRLLRSRWTDDTLMQRFVDVNLLMVLLLLTLMIDRLVL